METSSDGTSVTAKVYVPAIQQTGNLDKALASAQAEFKPVNKSKTAKVRGEKNGQRYEYEYKYADLADILGMALPILAKHGISFSQPLRRRDNKLFVVTRLAHQGEVQEDDGLAVPEQVKPQELGTYLSYFRRYSASTVLGISTEEDIDGPSDTGEVKETSKSPKRATPIIHQPAQGVQVTPAPKFVANESDVPSNIGSTPTKEEMAHIKESLKSFGIETDKLKSFSLKVSGRTAVKDITKPEWDIIINNLQTAKSNGNIEQLVA